MNQLTFESFFGYDGKSAQKAGRKVYRNAKNE